MRRSLISLALGVVVLPLAACAGTPTATAPSAPAPSTPAPSTPAPPSSSGAAAGVVPWADLPAAHLSIPATVLPATPAPAPADVPACRSSQLALEVRPAGAAGGTYYEQLGLRLAGTTACEVDGLPTVTWHDGTALLPIGSRPAALGTYDVHRRVLLTPSQTATVVVAWADAACTPAPPPKATSVTLRLASGATVTAAIGRRSAEQSCVLGPDHAGIPGSTGSVQPVMVFDPSPTHYQPRQVTNAWHFVQADDDQPLHLVGAPGGTLRFTVTLTSRGRDTPMTTCPDYTMSFYGVPHPLVERHQLNCAAVPYLSADGTPYLPAGVPVTFAMEAVAPSTASLKAIWQIVAKPPYIGVGGSYTPSS
jgi:hypothetical protein